MIAEGLTVPERVLLFCVAALRRAAKLATIAAIFFGKFSDRCDRDRAAAVREAFQDGRWSGPGVGDLARADAPLGALGSPLVGLWWGGSREIGPPATGTAQAAFFLTNRMREPGHLRDTVQRLAALMINQLN
jgi:hypothetical protein